MNFEKNITLGKTLARKLIVAIAERRQQGLEFAELDKSSKREEWRKRVDQWYEDEDTDSPFILAGGKTSGPGQCSIAEELRQAELEDARAGHVPFMQGNMTATAFVQAGLQLEETQIGAALKNKSLTATNASEIQELRMLQLIYMPGVATIREADDAKRNPNLPPPQPEALWLYLPSDLSDDDRRSTCVRQIVETEVGLRRGQYADALIVLQNLMGQRARTRSATLMLRLLEAITRIASKYRSARVALVALKDVTFIPEFKDLLDSDLNCRLESESNAASIQQLRSADGSRATHSEPNTRRLTGPMSWIWQGEGAQELHDAVQVEWSKAYARKARWGEEVDLVREETKHVLCSLLWEQTQWQERADRVWDDTDADVGGWPAIAEGFYADWGKSVAVAVRDAMHEDGALYRALIEGAFGRDEEAAPLDNDMAELERFAELERSTRTRALINRNEGKVKLHAEKYQSAWRALVALVGQEHMGFTCLLKDDIHCMDNPGALPSTKVRERAKERRRAEANVARLAIGDFPLVSTDKDDWVEQVDDDDEDIAGTSSGTAKAKAKAKGSGESRHVMSWIWEDTAPAGSNEELDDAVRIEWSKAYARMRRWHEEEQILIEEWRWLPLSLQHVVDSWGRRRVEVTSGGDDREVLEGKVAYAEKQRVLFLDLIVRAEVTRTRPKSKRAQKARLDTGMGRDEESDEEREDSSGHMDSDEEDDGDEA
ncbi:CxC2 domain-containing protein [Mycena chlorophos]|uniref:CxC2 domain-containing protein n=1 Tax=Mycena chlorophos TaxID=658473 RepID=A0A8H6VSC5_MYCCL|nr:CxC2 domain-containing protein [Mycena chlorophos]